MTSQPLRSWAHLEIAIITAGALILLGILVSGTREPTTTVTKTYTTTVTTIPIQRPTLLHQVVFSQSPICDYEYGIPWGVKLGNSTIIEPPNNTLPKPPEENLYGILSSEALINRTKIVFSVPDGTYQYTILPAGDFFPAHIGGNLTGSVSVNGRDVLTTVTPIFPGRCGF